MKKQLADQSLISPDDIFQLSRVALSGRRQDTQLYIRRLASRYRKDAPDLAAKLKQLLRESPSRVSPLRKSTSLPIPVDRDSRLQLVRLEQSVELELQPIYIPEIQRALDQLVNERKESNLLLKAGLNPTRSALFTGPPGVGKTLAARWIAQSLQKPLLILDLSAVMSSFLGRTGNNVRTVIDYAKEADCILLLDELDAVAKRRDDATEVGELKRLVTVLLQEIDDWPIDNLLLTATNHPDLLDIAVWRRFELIVKFPLPNDEQIRTAIELHLSDMDEHNQWVSLLTPLFKGAPFSEIEQRMIQVRKSALINRDPLNVHLAYLVDQRISYLSHGDRISLAVDLVRSKYVTQHRAQELTGVSRDTIRKYINQERSRRSLK